MQIDATSAFGQRVEQRLREDAVIWLVTNAPDGTPEPSPVWFYWDGETFLIYSLPDSPRSRNLARNPRVALHFDSTRGANVVVFTGTASIDESAPPPHENTAYATKYHDDFGRIGLSPQQFSRKYSLPIRVRPTKLRGH